MLTVETKFNHLQEIVVRLHAAAEGGLEHIANSVRDDWKEHAPVGPNRPHPSGKGNHPHYRDTIESLPNPGGDGYIVTSPTPYAQFLETGTYKMAAKPSFTPAVERARARFGDGMERAIIGAIS